MKRIYTLLALSFLTACGDGSSEAPRSPTTGISALTEGGEGTQTDTNFEITNLGILRAVDQFAPVRIHGGLVSDEICTRTSPDDQIDPVTYNCTEGPSYIDSNYIFKLNNVTFDQEFFSENPACYTRAWIYSYDQFTTCSTANPCVEVQDRPGIVFLNAYAARTKCTNGYDNGI